MAHGPKADNMSQEDIDLELVMIDPVYRRRVIDLLNAESRSTGDATGDAAPGRDSEIGAKRPPAGDR